MTPNHRPPVEARIPHRLAIARHSHGTNEAERSMTRHA
jgi:hypothetical protein